MKLQCIFTSVVNSDHINMGHCVMPSIAYCNLPLTGDTMPATRNIASPFELVTRDAFGSAWNRFGAWQGGRAFGTLEISYLCLCVLILVGYVEGKSNASCNVNQPETKIHYDSF